MRVYQFHHETIEWFPHKESNLDIVCQKHLYYRYTTGEYANEMGQRVSVGKVTEFATSST